MTTTKFFSTLLDQLALINETMNDIMANLESVMEQNAKGNIRPCDCCKAFGETLHTSNNQYLCRNCYEEYKDMFN